MTVNNPLSEITVIHSAVLTVVCLGCFPADSFSTYMCTCDHMHVYVLLHTNLSFSEVVFQDKHFQFYQENLNLVDIACKFAETYFLTTNNF